MKCIQSFLISSVLLLLYMMSILFVISLLDEVVPLFQSAGVNLAVSIVSLIVAYKLTQKTMEKWLGKRFVCRR